MHVIIYRMIDPPVNGISHHRWYKIMKGVIWYNILVWLNRCYKSFLVPLPIQVKNIYLNYTVFHINLRLF